MDTCDVQARRGESVASKIMRVLDAFCADGVELGPSEIARRSGLPYATTHRLLAELVRVGALQHGDGGRYSIGLRLWGIGSLTPERIRLRDAALPYLHLLSAAGPAQRNRAHLNVLDGDRGLRLERLSSRQAVLAAGNTSTFPLHATSGGQVLLAYAAPGVVEQLLTRPPARCTRGTITTPDQLQVVLAGIRRFGVALSDQQYRPGQADLAAPVFGANGSVVASVELVVAAGGDLREHVPAVRSAAAALSATVRTTAQEVAKAASKAAAGGSNARSATN